MLTRLFVATARYRRTVLTLGLTVATGCLTTRIWMPASTDRAWETLVPASIALIVLAVVALSRARPRSFDVRPQVPAFTAPPSAGDIFMTLAQLAMTTNWAELLLRGLAGGEPLIDPRLALFLPVLMVVNVAGTWRAKGIELRPDGLRDREALGTLVVPWDALPVVPLPGPADRRHTLRVRYAHPDLVRRRGLVTSRKRLSTSTIDPQVAAQLIRYYTTHPEHRSAIGTHAEHDRVMTEIQDRHLAAGEI